MHTSIFLKINEKWMNLKKLIGPQMKSASIVSLNFLFISLALLDAFSDLCTNMQAAYSKTSYLYETCVDVITPRFIQVGQTMQPYLQV
jgi:hypothetical protein